MVDEQTARTPDAPGAPDVPGAPDTPVAHDASGAAGAPTAPACAPTVLHEGPGWLVVNKPAGWHSVAQSGGGEHSVEAWLRTALPELAACPEAGLAHRLDAGTSGCVAVGCTPEVQQRLRQAFAGTGGAGVRKVYLAVARAGLAAHGRFALHFTNRHKGSAKVTVRDRGERHERGECTWQVIGAAVVPGHDLVEVRLVGPGRRHQIRAGCAHLGHPLHGDTLYGGEEAPHTPHPALHAWQVVIDGVTVVSEPPPRFTAASEPSRPAPGAEA